MRFSTPKSDTLRLVNGTIDAESIRATLDAIPTDASRIILLSAHSQHAFKVLEEAHKMNFKPETIWVGGSSWMPRYTSQDFTWIKGKNPGYLGVAPFRNRDEYYDEFLKELQSWQVAHGKAVTTELPAFARETVDAIRAMTQALAFAKDKRDGAAVVHDLRNLQFNGVSGWVQFTEKGDRRYPRYSIFNADAVSDDGTLSYNEVGVTGTKVGTTDYLHGFRDICFAVAGCNLIAPPSDSYPDPPLPVPAWVIPLIVVIICVLLFFVFRAIRERERGNAHKREKIAWIESVATMRIAEFNCIPKVGNIVDLEAQTLPTWKKRSANTVPEKAVWMFQETPGFMFQHKSSQIWGDPNDLWVLYDEEGTAKLENAFKRKKRKVTPRPGYTVNLKSMMQTKIETNFRRKVQRAVDENYSSEASTVSSSEVSLTDMKVSDPFPADLEGEAQMVLVKGDIVQISKSREHDDWRFGTKVCRPPFGFGKYNVHSSVWLT